MSAKKGLLEFFTSSILEKLSVRIELLLFSSLIFKLPVTSILFPWAYSR